MIDPKTSEMIIKQQKKEELKQRDLNPIEYLIEYSKIEIESNIKLEKSKFDNKKY